MATKLKFTDAPKFVETDLTYLTASSAKPTVDNSVPAPPGGQKRTGEFSQRRVPIFDGRPFAAQFSLDQEGFEFHTHETVVDNFLDDDTVRNDYYPEVTRLVKAATGASDVFIFDHTVRLEDDAAPRFRWCTMITRKNRARTGSGIFCHRKRRRGI